MTQQVKIEHQNFAAGEVGRHVRAHTDLRLYQSGVERCENFVVLAEGVLTRRPGTRFIAALKDETAVGRLLPFRYSGSDSYMILLNGGKARFVKNGALLGAPYEINSPYTTNTLEWLRAVGVGNIVYLANGALGYAPMQLTRAADTSWAFSDYVANDGPFEIQNLDKAKVISASGVSGSVALTGSGIAWTANQVGTLWRLDESNLALLPEWQANETLAPVIEPIPAGAVIGNFINSANAFDANAATDATRLGVVLGYVGMSSASRIRSAKVTASAGIGFCNSNGFAQLRLFGKQGAAPASETDGTELASQIVADAAGLVVTLTSIDQTTTFDHRWIVLATAPGDNIAIAEVAFDRFQAVTAVRRRWNGNVYDALNNGATGPVPPTHTEGDAIHGDITWRYRHGSFGVVRLTAWTDADHVSADVITALPDSVIAQPTYRWSPPSWSPATGFPDNVQLFGNRLSWSRKNRFWQTAPNTPLSFLLTADELSALSETLTQEDGTLPDIQWMMASGILVFGTRDGEWIERGPSSFDPLTPQNIRIISDSTEGSCPQIPARVDGGAAFIGRSRDRLHYVKFDRLSEALNPVEISKGARHLVERGARRLAWDRDPNRILWVRTGIDGAERLVGVTLMPEEQIVGFHQHPMDRTADGLPLHTLFNCVEDIATIPTSDEGRSDTYMIVRRRVGGVDRRFLEQRQPFFQPADPDAPTAAGAWFVDCGIRTTGSQLTTVTAAHLKGATVRVFADGGDQGLRVCNATTGAVAVDPPADDVLVGLPIVARVRDLPRNVQTPQGTSKMSGKRGSHAEIDVVFSVGGKIRSYDARRSDGGLMTALTPTGTAVAGAALPLRTGRIIESISGSWGEEVQLELVCDNALPFTLAGFTPKLQIGD